MKPHLLWWLALLPLVLAACVTLDDYRFADGTLDGERLYQRRCSTCHDTFERQDYPTAEWPTYVERYGPRAGLNPEARAAVLRYLTKQ
ncbi:MAG: cytochrome c [Planctomycetes bacterium]|nr:cytochrome c [Planctomycetota bacterium]